MVKQPIATAPTTSGNHIPEELDWCAAIQQGDELAAEKLVRKHGDRLYGALYHLVNGNSDLAAELTQEAWAHACTRLSHYDGSCQFFTWLYRVGRNRALDTLRRRRPHSQDPTTIDSANHHPDDANQVEIAEKRQYVQQALALLTTEQQEIILLRDFEDLDYQVIAETLGIALGTVKSRLSRARAALRDHVIALAGSKEAL